MTNNKLDKWVCTNPFKYLDVNHSGSYMCCPSWLPEELTEQGSPNPLTITEGWYSEKADQIRRSVLDGSFKYCDHKLCPDINAVLGGREIETDNFRLRENFTPPDDPKIESILYGQDRSCNLRCPSCRLDTIVNDNVKSPAHQRKLDIQNEIENNFGDSIQRILLTGSGDPIYSKIYRDFLINFNRDKYPQLSDILIVTNGVLLNKKMWDSFNCKEYISSFDISYDAGTKETYENITRIGGTWDRLIDNTKFLLSLTDRPRKFIFSYVVSELNFHEMKLFTNIINDLAKTTEQDVSIHFRQHVFWGSGAYTPDEVENISVFNPDHKLHNEFLAELALISNDPMVNHNFHHLL